MLPSGNDQSNRGVTLPARAERWSLPRTLAGLAASIPPFTSLIFERWVARRRVPHDGPALVGSTPD